MNTTAVTKESAQIAASAERKRAGLLAMAGCAVLWSMGGLFIKLIDWQPFAIAGARSAIAALFLFIWIRKPKFTFSLLQISSALAYAATMLLFVFANKHTTAANAILLQYGAPVYVVLLGSYMLKEVPKLEEWLALLAICVGMVLFFMDSLAAGHLLGDTVAVISGFAFALNIVLMRKQKDADPLSSMLLGHIFAAIIAGIISLFLAPPVVSLRSLAAISALGVVQIGLAAVLFSYGIKRVTALQGVLTAVIEPIFNPVWVFLVTGEIPGGKSILGGLIIISAVLISSIISIRKAGKGAS